LKTKTIESTRRVGLNIDVFHHDGATDTLSSLGQGGQN
jgi:hypothetical protein